MDAQQEQSTAFAHTSSTTSIIDDMKQRLEYLFENSSKSDVYALFEEKTGLSSKSLRNWISSKNLPYPQSISAFYSLFLGIRESEFPQIVLNYFAEKKYVLSSSEETREISNWLKGKPLHTKIYRMIKIGYNIEKSIITEYFGRIGTRCIEDLEKMNLVTIVENEVRLTNISTNPSINYFLTCAQNHTQSFNFEEIRNNPVHSESKFLNFIYEIKESDVSNFWQDMHESQFKIFEKYAEKADSDTIVIECTTLLDQLKLSKKEVLQ